MDSTICSMVIATYALTGSASQMRQSTLQHLTSTVHWQEHIHLHSPDLWSPMYLKKEVSEVLLIRRGIYKEQTWYLRQQHEQRGVSHANWEQGGCCDFFASAFIMIATNSWVIFIGMEIWPFSLLWNVFLHVCVQVNTCHFMSPWCSLFLETWFQYMQKFPIWNT